MAQLCVPLAITRLKSLLGDRVLGNELLSHLLFWLPPLKLTELVASDASGFLEAEENLVLEESIQK